MIKKIETFDATTIRSSTPQYLLAKKIQSRGFKMVMSGEGADEAWGGYLYFHYAPNDEGFEGYNMYDHVFLMRNQTPYYQSWDPRSE